jgi:hypothetical protein
VATSMQTVDSHANPVAVASAARSNLVTWDLEDERILIDIETEMATRSQIGIEDDKSAQRTPHFLVDGRTLGPLSVLLILMLYSLLSPLLSPAIHVYIYRILH